MPRISNTNHTTAAGAYRFGDFELAPSERQLTRRGKTIRVTPKSFDALLLFVRNADRLVRREEMVETLWPDAHVTDANLTNLIVGPRKLLGRRVGLAGTVLPVSREVPGAFADHAGSAQAALRALALERSSPARTTSTRNSRSISANRGRPPFASLSVAHTHFLRCNYAATLQTYGQTRYYLDAAAWAALGETGRATRLLQERLTSQQLSPLMSGLMSSLLALLRDRRDDAVALIHAMPIEPEPEVVFYLARHLSVAGDADAAVQMLQRARKEGLTSVATLEQDDAFAPCRPRPAFKREVREAAVSEQLTRTELERAGLARAVRRDALG